MLYELGSVKLYIDIGSVSGSVIKGSVLFSMGSKVEKDMVNFIYSPEKLLVLIPRSWFEAPQSVVKRVVGEIGAKICDGLESQGFKVHSSVLSIGVN